MEELRTRLEAHSEKLENDEDYWMSDEMQEEYYGLQELIERYDDHLNDDVMFQKLKRDFSAVNEEYGTPDSEAEGTLKMMFPDTDGQFELDDVD